MNVFQTLLPFSATQIVNLFLNSGYSANHDKGPEFYKFLIPLNIPLVYMKGVEDISESENLYMILILDVRYP